MRAVLGRPIALIILRSIITIMYSCLQNRLFCASVVRRGVGDLSPAAQPTDVLPVGPRCPGLPVAAGRQRTQLAERRVDDAIDPGLERHRHNLDHRRVLANFEHAAARAGGSRLDRRGQLDGIADMKRVSDDHRRSNSRAWDTRSPAVVWRPARSNATRQRWPW